MEMLLSNTYGKIWMIGGGVSRLVLDYTENPNHRYEFDYWNLCSLGEFPCRDFDFIVEEIHGNFRLSAGWEIQRNTFGGVKVLKTSPYNGKVITVDMWKLRKHEPCRRNSLEYTIENVLRLAPLTIQAIAFDTKDCSLIGEAGINSLLTKTVGVNNRNEALNYCKVYKTDLETFIRRKAKEYDFTPIL